MGSKSYPNRLPHRAVEFEEAMMFRRGCPQSVHSYSNLQESAYGETIAKFCLIMQIFFQSIIETRTEN